jgi:hypothetical protein
MTRHPFDSEELGTGDELLDSIGVRLEGYAAEAAEEPPRDLSVRIRTAVDAEASRRRPLAALVGPVRGPARVLAAAGLLALAVTGAIVVGQLANLARQRIGSSPDPSVISSPSESSSPTPSHTPSPTPTISERPSPSRSPTQLPAATPSPPTPEATPSGRPDDSETPHPSGSDNSGPGGGGGNSGPGGGGSSGSGSGGD